MSNKNQAKNAAAEIVASSIPALRTITRSEAKKLCLGRAIECYNEAQAVRNANIRTFEAEHGRCDRIDASLLHELQRLQLRFAAIAARQQRSHSYGEPKVSKYVEQLGVMLGSVSAHLATDRALELFAPVNKAEYVGWDGKEAGDKGHDESVLEGYVVVDDEDGSAEEEPDEEGDACVHHRIEPLAENPNRGICVDCDEEFPLRSASETTQQVA
jgi:hypothetical protein